MTSQELDGIAREVRRRHPAERPSSGSNMLYVVEDGLCPLCGAAVHYQVADNERRVIEDPDGTPHACVVV